MSDKTYDKEVGAGFYSYQIASGPRSGLHYGVRVWVPSARKTLYFKLAGTQAQAKKEYKRIAADPEAALKARDGVKATPLPAGRLRFSGLVTAFLAGYKGRSIRRQTNAHDHYYFASRSWLAYFGKVYAADITKGKVEAYRDSLVALGRGDSTIKKWLTALCTMYKWGIDKSRNLVIENPVIGVVRPPEPRRLVEVIAVTDQPGLLKATDASTARMIEFYILSGLRCSEGLSLRWANVTSQTISIVGGKTGVRVVNCSKTLQALLNSMRPVKADPDAHVITDGDGKPLDRQIVSSRVRAAIKASGLRFKKGACFNLFRHTYGSRLAESDVSMAKIAVLMGNSEEIIMRHYLSFSPATLQNAVNTQDTENCPQAVPGDNVVQFRGKAESR